MAEALETGQNTGIFVDVELLDLACEIVLECREVIEDGSRLAYLPAGLAEGVELALLFILKAHGYVNGEARALWKSGQDGEPSLPLLTAYCTTAQPVRLRAHDREVGPVASAYDPGLILNAMRRAGILEYKFETYGVLFRAPNEKALFDAIALPESEAVVGAFSGGGAYGIVQSDREGHALPVQEAGDVLGGRSALYIALPVSAHLRIPLLVLHNRFTGTAEIKAMDDPAYGLGLSQGDKVIRARILTLLEVAKVAKGGSEPKAMIAASIRRPLIVGDFNFPREIIDEPSSASNNVAARRYAYLRRELRFGMEMHGYFRRTSAPPQTATSLVSYASIASLNTVYSQPYDAVYQPFDFLGGAAQVRSGVIQGIRTMFETSLLTEPLTVAPVVQQDAPDVVMNEEDPDEDEKAEVADPDAMDDAPVADNAPQQATTFNTVLADEICRIYRSLGRAAVQDIANSAEWARKSTTLRRKGPHVQWQLDHARLTAMIAARAQHLREQILATPFEPVAISQAPLGEWLAAAAAAVAACPGRAPKATLNLRATLKTLFDRLVNLETNVDARLWVGYRALVSDHLPVIVEIDLQPY
jgi:hypothetical protein